MDESTVAAVDLGSNSFHMVVARVVRGRVDVLDRLKERVALAEGLDDDKRLSEEAQARAIGCLERFGQRLRDMPAGSVRAVGTNTLRQARGARAFLSKARKALRHPIDVVSGREEARLIYLGVAHSLPTMDGRRFVVDIGGGSTECVVGEGFDVRMADSLYMGCVSHSRRFFPGGRVTSGGMEDAKVAALVELEPLRRAYSDLGWQGCFGSSGTVLAIDDILRRQAWSQDGIDGPGLAALRIALVEAGRVDRVELAGLEDERRPVIAGGAAILSAVFETFAIERMLPATGALREGVVYDLLGRLSHEDVRDRTIRELSERYHVDAEHGARVERTALALLDQVAAAWGLDNDAEPRPRQLLSWAARLHEVGLQVAHAGYHKHGAYLVAHSDMPGFSVADQEALAALVRSHRRKLPSKLFEDLPAPRQSQRLCVLLRLAVLLNRSRSPRPHAPVTLAVDGDGIGVRAPGGWLESNPLTRADLLEEARQLQRAGFTLEV